MGLAGQGQLVDVGVAAGGEVLDRVVSLGLIERPAAAGFGAAPIPGEQRQPLRGGGIAFGPPEIQDLLGVIVEHGQVVVRVRRSGDDIAHRQSGAATGVGPPGHGQVVVRVRRSGDDIAHRQSGAATGVGPPGRRFQLTEGGGHHDGGGDAVELSHLLAVDRDRQRGAQCVVVALFLRPRVELAVPGVGGAVFGDHDVEQGPGDRIDPAADLTHAVRPLGADDQAAPALLEVFVGFGAVGVDQVDQVLGDLPQPVGIQVAAVGGEIGLDPVAGGVVDPAGQPVQGLADDVFVLGAEPTVGDRLGHMSQLGGQFLAGQRAPGPEPTGRPQPAIRLGTGDPQPQRQHLTPAGLPELVWIGLGHQMRGETAFDRRPLPGDGLERIEPG
ncbi:hypothetical protein MHAS44199_06690 [Mycolicibacterium hassiacum DSM 44199]|nr:hypothetical protein [Mycolicibacterium hassiacum DSM 44199]